MARASEHVSLIKAETDRAWSRKATAVLQQLNGDYRLEITEQPQVLDTKQETGAAIDAYVRLFNLGVEVPIDPHRIIVNPPTVPRANLTYEVGAITEDGDFEGTGQIISHATRTSTKGVAYRRIVGAADPTAAFWEALWDSVFSVPNPRGFGTRGTVTTVFATAPGGNGYVQGDDGTYLTARAGTGSLNAGANHRVGQTTGYICYESCLIFDTSGVPDTDTVVSAVASLDGNADLSTTDFTGVIIASAYDGGQVATTDYVAGATLAAATQLATWASSGYSSAYNAFTSTGSNFTSAINKTGNTAIVVVSQRMLNATVPTGTEYVIFTDADAAGTGSDAKLDIVHYVPSQINYGGTTGFTAGNGTSVGATAKPTGTQIGDVLVAQLYIESSDAPTIASSGDTWVPVHDILADAATDFKHWVWICVVANATSTVGVTWGGGSYWRDFSVSNYWNVDTTTPQDATATENTGSSDTPLGTGLTTATDDAFLVLCVANFDGRTHASWSSPLSERHDGGNVAEASGEQASLGASGNKTVTLSSTSVWTTILLALRLLGATPPSGAAGPLMFGGRLVNNSMLVGGRLIG